MTSYDKKPTITLIELDKCPLHSTTPPNVDGAKALDAPTDINNVQTLTIFNTLIFVFFFESWKFKLFKFQICALCSGNTNSCCRTRCSLEDKTQFTLFDLLAIICDRFFRNKNYVTISVLYHFWIHTVKITLQRTHYSLFANYVNKVIIQLTAQFIIGQKAQLQQMIGRKFLPKIIFKLNLNERKTRCSLKFAFNSIFFPLF